MWIRVMGVAVLALLLAAGGCGDCGEGERRIGEEGPCYSLCQSTGNACTANNGWAGTCLHMPIDALDSVCMPNCVGPGEACPDEMTCMRIITSLDPKAPLITVCRPE